MFANMYRAYDALSDGMKQMLAGLKSVSNGDSKKHSTGMTRAQRAKAGVGQMAQIDPTDIKIQTISTHPLIRTHPETRRKVLYVGGHIERFHGMTDAESEPLLGFLMAHATRPEFTVRLRWEIGTVTLWDNRCTQHYALNDYAGFRRRMHKITISGDTPY
jgi:taurine dioxygenase